MSAELNKSTRVVAARLPREQYDRVVELSNEAGQTRGEFIREAVLGALEREEGPPEDDG